MSGHPLRHPSQEPGAGLALTPEQQRGLADALKSAPHPAEVLRLVREGLHQRRPLTRILEDIRQRDALLVMRQYAAPPERWPERLSAAPAEAEAPRDLPRAPRRAAAPVSKAP